MITESHQSDPHTILITGERDTGKTTLCLALHRRLTRQGINVSGMITQQLKPHTLVSLELRSGERHTLTHPFDSDLGVALTYFRVNPQAMAHSAESLRNSFPTQIFILDELGPLELVRGEGWVEALTLLDPPEYDVALVVVRPALLEAAIRQLPANWFTVVQLTLKNRDEVQERLACEILSIVDAPARP